MLPSQCDETQVQTQGTTPRREGKRGTKKKLCKRKVLVSNTYKSHSPPSRGIKIEKRCNTVSTPKKQDSCTGTHSETSVRSGPQPPSTCRWCWAWGSASRWDFQGKRATTCLTPRPFAASGCNQTKNTSCSCWCEEKKRRGGRRGEGKKGVRRSSGQRPVGEVRHATQGKATTSVCQ